MTQAMKFLFVSGSDETSVESLASALCISGVTSITPSLRAAGVDLDRYRREPPSVDPRDGPWASVLRDSISGLLDMAGPNEAVHWYHPEGHKLLDQWRDLDPGIAFVLVCVSPVQYVLSAIHGEEDGVVVTRLEAALQRWYTIHREILRFNLHNPERCILVSADEATAFPEEFLAACASRWQLGVVPCQSVAMASATSSSEEHLAGFLVEQWVSRYPEVASFWQELQAAQFPLSTDLNLKSSHLDGALEGFAELVCGLSRLQTREASLLEELNKVTQKRQAEAASLQSRIDELLLQCNGEALGLTESNSEYQRQIAELQAKLDVAEAASARGSEHLILELHRSQQQLEHLLADQGRLEQQLEHLLADKGHLEQQLQSQKNQTAQYEQARQQLTDASEKLLEQMHQYQLEVESLHQHISDQQHQHDQLRVENVELQSQLEKVQHASRVAARESTERLGQLERQGEQQQAQFDNKRDHLLLKLERAHQESEAYCIQAAELKSRLDTVFAREPHRFFCKRVQVEHLGGKSATLRWRFDSVVTATQSLAAVELDTQLEKRDVNLLIRRATSPLKSWPVSHADQEEIRISAKTPLAILEELSDVDWQLIRGVTCLISQELDGVGLSKAVTGRYRKAFDRLLTIQADCPDMLRFEGVNLLRTQCNPDYEHLWLEIQAPALNGVQHERWAFRLACANVGPKRFGSHPKLEFPEEAKQWLSGWYSETEDDFGPKLELRYALPKDMDIAVWNRLSEEDHQKLWGMTAALPRVLNHLRCKGALVDRPWDQWLAAADSIAEITAGCTPKKKSEAAAS